MKYPICGTEEKVFERVTDMIEDTAGRKMMNSHRESFYLLLEKAGVK